MINIEKLLKISIDNATKFLIDLLEEKSVTIKHPKLNIPTYPRSSQISGMANIIHFSDADLNNHWYYIQITRLVDGYYIPGGELVNPRNMPGVTKAQKQIDNNETQFDLKSTSHSINGLVFSQKRPYHYFYDQFVNYFKLSNIKNIDHLCFTDNTCFYSEAGSAKFEKINTTGCYFFPCTVDGNYDDIDAKKMHHFLKNNSEKIEIESKLTIWIGITGQKRSWVEQVDGYVEIIKKLNKTLGRITVLIDGLSNYENDNSKDKDDIEVYNLIENQLYPHPSIKVISLINKNYKTKISYANACDYFIANSGTGCMVPFMFANKKGVIHGNGQLNTFFRSYNKDIRTIPKEKIIAEQSSATMNNSYSINWKTIYNALMDIMGNVERLEEQSPKPSSKIIFSNLEFTKNTEPADALRDIAMSFEKIGDRKTAYSIMCKALEQRPSGPFIKRKVEEWKAAPKKQKIQELNHEN